MDQIEWAKSQVELIRQRACSPGTAFTFRQINQFKAGEGQAQFRIIGHNEIVWDWWPYSRLRTAYSPTTGKTQYHIDAIRLIALACPGIKPKPKPKKKKKRIHSKPARWKERVYGEDTLKPCHYCGTLLTKNLMTVDHFVPLAHGGSHSPSNFILSCEPCNQDKGHQLPHEAERGKNRLDSS